MNVIKKIYRYINAQAQEKKIISEQSKYQIQFYNCWKQKNEDMYWGQFISHRHLLDSLPNKTLALFSVFGKREIIDKIAADYKIFYSAENLGRDNFHQYADYCLSNPSINLAMGFDYIDNPRYIRFPLWMDYMFDPWLSTDEIRKKCAELRFPKCTGKDKLCCMVASNPGDGLRKEMFDGISKFCHVDSSGRFLHNDDSLKTEFGDRKTDYLSRYCLNICPENTDAPGYVTEKIFESISCGCVPIYWGSSQHPEPNVLNLDAIIMWDREHNGAIALGKLFDLLSSSKQMQEFMSQPRLLPTAEEFILDTFSSVEQKFKDIIYE